MRRATIAFAIALLAAVMLANVSFANGARPAAPSPQPTATYVSELGPASVRPPQRALALPLTGSDLSSGLPWAKLAGLALAIGGAALIHAGLTLRPRPLNPS